MTLNKVIPRVEKAYGDQQQSWVDEVAFDAEYAAELQGIAQAINHPTVTLDRLKWLNMFYEMDSPVNAGCSDVLWAMPNGRVVHGRNLDDFSPDANLMDWPALTFDAVYYRGGQPLLKTTCWPGSVGIGTALRYDYGGGGWSFAQNTRKPNDWQENLAAARKGGLVFALAARRIMETTPDFATALHALYSTKFMAPQYFAISGSGPFEGAVLTIDRLGQHSLNTPPIQRLSSEGDDWHLVQTNDDLLSEAADPRRPLANYLLQSSARDITLSEDSMLQFMHTSMLFNEGTIFSTVMTPATGYYKTILPDEPPEVVDGSQGQTEMVGMWSNLQLSQVFSRQSAPSSTNRKRRFLAPPTHRVREGMGAEDAHHQPHKEPIANALQTSPDDEVSFMQVSLKLEA